MATCALKLWRSKTLVDGSHPVVIVIRSRGKRKVIHTKLNSTIDQWDEEKNNINPRRHPAGREGYMALKKLLISWEQKVFHAEKIQFKGDIIKAVTAPDPSRISIIEFSREIAEEQRSRNPGNAKVYQTLVDQLENLRMDVPLSQVDYDFVHKFKYYKYASGISNNSLHTYLRTLRAVINQAINRGLYDANKYPFRRGIMPKLEPTKKKALDPKHIHAIYNFEPKGIRQERCKNLLILSFELRGLDMIDILHLEKDDIQNGRIEKVRLKTKQPLSVLLTDKAKSLLNGKGRFLFPLLDRSKFEDPISYKTKTDNVLKSSKAIAESIGVSSGLRLKVMRHSFATIGKHLGCPREVMSELLGHSSKTVTEIYQSPFSQDYLDEWHQKIIQKVMNEC